MTITDNSRVDLLDPDVATDVIEYEVSWPDQFGHPLGKRLPRTSFDAALRDGVTFCDGALAWDVVADVQQGVTFTNWETGYPDALAHPDLDTLRPLPWRPGVAHVIADVTDRHGIPLAASPRQVLRRVIDQLAQRGFTASVGIELEFYLLGADGQPLQDSAHCYSLDKVNQADPALSQIIDQLRDFTPIEAVGSEYGPSQFEVNLHHTDALTTADNAFRFRYGLRTLARQHGLLATFMAKPFAGVSGSSAHLHVSLWRDGKPVFATIDGNEPPLARHAIAGLLAHLAGIAVYGAPTVNSYKRYEAGSFAPISPTWSGDNRTAAVRSLTEAPAATRIEVRTPASDANPYWAIAATLAAVIAGIDAAAEPPGKGTGNLYNGAEPALPTTLVDAVTAARRDTVIAEILGSDPAYDYTALALGEWHAYTREVTTWERDRYLTRI